MTCCFDDFCNCDFCQQVELTLPPTTLPVLTTQGFKKQDKIMGRKNQNFQRKKIKFWFLWLKSILEPQKMGFS